MLVKIEIIKMECFLQQYYSFSYSLKFLSFGVNQLIVNKCELSMNLFYLYIFKKIYLFDGRHFRKS